MVCWGLSQLMQTYTECLLSGPRLSWLSACLLCDKKLHSLKYCVRLLTAQAWCRKELRAEAEYCTSYFPIALTRLWWKAAYRMFTSAVIPESASVRQGSHSSKWVERGRKLGDQIFNHKHKAKRAKWKCGKAMHSETHAQWHPPNSTAGWGPSVQMPESPHISCSNHIRYVVLVLFCCFFFFKQNCLSILSFVTVYIYVNISCWNLKSLNLLVLDWDNPMLVSC